MPESNSEKDRERKHQARLRRIEVAECLTKFAIQQLIKVSVREKFTELVWPIIEEIFKLGG